MNLDSWTSSARRAWIVTLALFTGMLGLRGSRAWAQTGGTTPAVAPQSTARRQPAGTASLSGTVTDVAGNALVAARVSLPELDLETLTSETGAFAFATVPVGRHELLVQRLGYAPLLQTVDLRSAEAGAAAASLALSLTETPFLIPGVNVTATRSAIDPMRSPLSEAELRPDQLARVHEVSLANALEKLSGVRSLSTGEQIGKPVVRGLAGARVLVMENGQRMEDYSFSDEDGPSMDVRLSQRVEVIRGPASVLYGSEAMGGVVNALPTPLPDGRNMHPFTRVGIEAYGSSGNAEFGSAVRAEGAKHNLAWRTFIVGRKGSDMHTPAGELPNTGFGAFSGELAGMMRADRGNLTLRYVHHGGEFKLLEAGGPPPSTGGEPAEEEGPERKANDDRVQVVGNLLRGNWRLEGRTQFQRHSLIEMSDEFPGVTPAASQGASKSFGPDPTIPLPGITAEKKEATAFDLLLNTWTADVLAHHAAGQRLTGTVGLSGAMQTNDTRGPIPLVPDADVKWGAAFAFEQLAMGQFTLLGGLRGDVRKLHADANSTLAVTDQDRDYDAVSGDLGAVYRPTDGLAVAVNAGTAWRAPTYFELFANGPQVGDQRYEQGDPSLKEETSINFDASLRTQLRRLRGEISFYRNQIDDFIYQAATGDTLQSLPVYMHQQKNAVLTGGEASLEFQALPILALRARAEYVHGSKRSNDEPLPLMPPVRGVLEAELGFRDLSWAERARLGAEVEMVDEQTRPSPLDQVTPGYVLLNMDAGIERTLAGRAFRVDVRVSNLLDHEYRDFLSRYKSFALDAGRDVTLRVGFGL